MKDKYVVDFEIDENTGEGILFIPEEICFELDLYEGIEVEIIKEEDHLLIKKI